MWEVPSEEKAALLAHPFGSLDLVLPDQIEFARAYQYQNPDHYSGCRSYERAAEDPVAVGTPLRTRIYRARRVIETATARQLHMPAVLEPLIALACVGSTVCS